MKRNFYTTLIVFVSLLFSGIVSAENIALSAVATASSNSNTAAQTVDGDDATRWESEHGVDPQWLALTLNEASAITEIKIHWEAANAKVYTVKVSEDSVNWVEVHSEMEGASADRWDVIAVSTMAKYIVITGTERNLTWGYSIYEIEVEGAVEAGKDASLTDLTVDGATIADFSAGTMSYVYGLTSDITVVPTVAVTLSDATATTVITDATALPGTTSVEVTSQDGTVTQTYAVSFVYSLPSTGAALPMHGSLDVLSVYSDAYTTNIATNLNPGWGQATIFSEEVIGTDNVLKYENLNYQGTEYTSSDVTAMEYLHLDYWTADATALEFYLIAGGENSYNISTEEGITTGEWVGVDIPLSYYAEAGRDLTSAIQFKTTGNGTLFIDNMYFWKSPTSETADVTLSDLTLNGETIADFASTKSTYDISLMYGTTEVPVVTATASNANATLELTETTVIPGVTTIKVIAEDKTDTAIYTVTFIDNILTEAAATPTIAAENVISVYSDAYTTIATNLNPGWGQSTAFSEEVIDGNNTMKYGELNYQGLEYATTDVSGMEYVHLDYWTVDATALDFYLVADGGESSYEIATELGITLGAWTSVDIPLSHYAGLDLTAAFQFKTTGNGTVYFDNLYFYNNSDPSGLDEIVKSSVSVYPNPVINTLQLSAETDIETVQILDLSGKCVLTVTKQTSIDVSTLQAGTYILSAQTGDTVTVTKFIKL